VGKNSENQPRRNEKYEEKSEKTFVFFVTLWLIFLSSLHVAFGDALKQ